MIHSHKIMHHFLSCEHACLCDDTHVCMSEDIRY